MKKNIISSVCVFLDDNGEIQYANIGYTSISTEGVAKKVHTLVEDIKNLIINTNKDIEKLNE